MHDHRGRAPRATREEPYSKWCYPLASFLAMFGMYVLVNSMRRADSGVLAQPPLGQFAESQLSGAETLELVNGARGAGRPGATNASEPVAVGLPPHVIHHAPRSHPIADVETLWSDRASEPKALLLMFHGCSHSAASFKLFPEHREWFDEAVRADLVPVAFTSQDRESGCWSHGDIPRIADALRTLLQRHPAWTALPAFVVGISSGGFLLADLIAGLPLRPAAAAFVVSGMPHLEADSAKRAPPSVFVHMPADKRTAALVADNIAALRGAGVAADELPAHPIPITADWLAGRPVDNMTPELAQEIVRAYPRTGSGSVVAASRCARLRSSAGYVAHP